MINKYALVIIREINLTDDMLIHSNIPEDDYPEYDPDEPYSLGERVIVAAEHRVYESMADDNLGNTPSADSVKWKSPGLTNRWRAFDERVYTRSSRPDLIEYQIKPGRSANGIGLLGVRNATSARVRLIDPVFGEVYDKTAPLGAITPAPSWWQWAFGARVERKQALFLDLPTFPNATLHITVTGGAQLGVGKIVFGQQRRFGYGVQYGARAGITSYSTVVRDLDGGASIKKRPTAKRNTLPVILPSAETDIVYDFLASIDSEPVLIIGSMRVSCLTGFGLVKNFEVVIPGPTVSECSIEFDGMT